MTLTGFCTDNYVASIKHLEKIMERFLLKDFHISFSRCYFPIDKGGIGMFSLADFISGNQCSWIKQGFHSINDNWQAKLAYLGHGNVLNVVHYKWAKCWVGA